MFEVRGIVIPFIEVGANIRSITIIEAINIPNVLLIR